MFKNSGSGEFKQIVQKCGKLGELVPADKTRMPRMMRQGFTLMLSLPSQPPVYICAIFDRIGLISEKRSLRLKAWRFSSFPLLQFLALLRHPKQVGLILSQEEYTLSPTL
jgi:hypothetical protein